MSTKPATAVPVGYPATAALVPQRVSGNATAAMVCGILGIIFFGIILGPLAIALGCSAKAEINENPREVTGDCQANTGIVCGIIALVAWVIIVVAYLAEM